MFQQNGLSCFLDAFLHALFQKASPIASWLLDKNNLYTLDEHVAKYKLGTASELCEFVIKLYIDQNLEDVKYVKKHWLDVLKKFEARGGNPDFEQLINDFLRFAQVSDPEVTKFQYAISTHTLSLDYINEAFAKWWLSDGHFYDKSWADLRNARAKFVSNDKDTKSILSHIDAVLQKPKPDKLLILDTEIRNRFEKILTIKKNNLKKLIENETPTVDLAGQLIDVMNQVSAALLEGSMTNQALTKLAAKARTLFDDLYKITRPVDHAKTDLFQQSDPLDLLWVLHDIYNPMKAVLFTYVSRQHKFSELPWPDPKVLESFRTQHDVDMPGTLFNVDWTMFENWLTQNRTNLPLDNIQRFNEDCKGLIVTRPTALDAEGTKLTTENKLPERIADCGIDLQTLVVHKGLMSDCGHYVAYIKCGGQWMMYDDFEDSPIVIGDFKALEQQKVFSNWRLATYFASVNSDASSNVNSDGSSDSGGEANSDVNTDSDGKVDGDIHMHPDDAYFAQNCVGSVSCDDENLDENGTQPKQHELKKQSWLFGVYLVFVLVSLMYGVFGLIRLKRRRG